MDHATPTPTQPPAEAPQAAGGLLRLVHAINRSSLDRTAKHTLLALLQWLSFDTYETFVGSTTVARATGLHYDTVRDTLTRLGALGVLSTSRPASGRRAATVRVDIDRLESMTPAEAPQAAGPEQTAPAPPVGSVPHRPEQPAEPRRVGPTPTLREPVGSVPHRPYAVGSELSPRRVGPTPTHQEEQKDMAAPLHAGAREADSGRPEQAVRTKPTPTPTPKPAPVDEVIAITNVFTDAWGEPLGQGAWSLVNRLAQVLPSYAKRIGIPGLELATLAIAEARKSQAGGRLSAFRTIKLAVTYAESCADNWARNGLPRGATKKPGVELTPRQAAWLDRLTADGIGARQSDAAAAVTRGDFDEELCAYLEHRAREIKRQNEEQPLAYAARRGAYLAKLLASQRGDLDGFKAWAKQRSAIRAAGIVAVWQWHRAQLILPEIAKQWQHEAEKVADWMRARGIGFEDKDAAKWADALQLDAQTLAGARASGAGAKAAWYAIVEICERSEA
jgi:hypothetical protein